MTPETTEKKSNLIEDVIKSRLNHPFIGTLFTSFIITNYDILLILFTKLNSNEVNLALLNFKTSLNQDSFRLNVPIISTLTIPFIIEPFANMIHQKILAVTRRWTMNWIEREEIKVIIDDYNRLKNIIQVKDNAYKEQINKLTNNLGAILNYIYKLNTKHFPSPTANNCYLFKSKQIFNPNELVSYSLEEKVIYPYTDDLYFAGKIMAKINENLYLVYLDYHLNEELEEVNKAKLPFSTVYYSYAKKKFVANLGDETLDQKRILTATKSGDRYYPNIKHHLSQDFPNQYLENLQNYLDTSNMKPEPSRNHLIKDLFLYFKKKLKI